MSGTHGAPFAVLGVHPAGKGFVARCFIPHAGSVEAFTLDGKSCGALQSRHGAGFFEGEVRLKKRQPVKYRAANEGGEGVTIALLAG